MDPINEEQIGKLLRLKKYEQPPPAYFDNFLHEFHRRQRDELLKEPLWRIAFQRTQDFHPRIDGGGCSSRRKRHDNSSSQGDNFSRGEPSARPTKSHPSNALPAAARKADDLLTSSGSTGGAIL